MSFKSDFYTYLSTQPGITALAATRVYEGVNASSTITYPYITFNRIGREVGQHATAADGVAVTTMQVDVWAQNGVDAEALEAAVRAELDGYGPAAMGSSTIHYIHSGNALDLTEFKADGSAILTSRITTDYTIGHAISVPTF